MHDLNQVVADCKRTMDAHKIPYGSITHVRVSSRMRRTWGSCRKSRDGVSTITISDRLLQEDVPLDSLKTLVIAVIGAVGVIILAKNVMEFAQAYQQQDSSTMNSALKGIVAGIMMAGISTVLTFLGF